MANTIANKLVVKSADSKVIKNLLKVIKGNNENGDKEVIDFNKINAMPTELEDTTSGSEQWNSICYYAQQTNQRDILTELFELFFPSCNNITCSQISRDYEVSSEELAKNPPEKLAEYLVEGEKYVNFYRKYGATDWYMWRINNWGTKRNAFDSYIVEESENECAIYFSSAWYGVPLLVEILARVFPDIEFSYKFADEDIAYNCGKGYSNGNGEFFFDMVDDCSDEAIKIYCECWDEDEEDYVKVDGAWIPADYLDDLEGDEDEE